MTFSAARLAAWLVPCLLALDVAAARATTPAFEFTLDDGYCGLALGHDVVPPADTIPPALRRLDDTGDGRKTFDYGCALVDGFSFGTADAPQSFLGSSTVRGTGELGYGQLRFSALASAFVDPARYLPQSGIGASNPYTATALHFSTVSFIDVITPPPTQAAPLTGNTTNLRFQLHLDCDESGDSLPTTSVFAAFYTPQVFDQGHSGRLMPFDSFVFKTEGTLGHLPCIVDTMKQVAAKVGKPIVLWAGITVVANARLADDTQPAHFSMSSTHDAMTVFGLDTDGHPLVGSSGHSYTPGIVLPTVTTTTSTTTTTTLPTEPNTCGDGVLQAGEQCDCPGTADPVGQGAGCTGASVLPAQPACVVCRQCAILTHLCAPPTTTTTIGPTTTTILTTTTLVEDTTTTTLPGEAACAGKVGIAHALCRLDVALRAPLCGTDAVPPRVDGALRKKLTRARDLLETAGVKTGKPLTRVLRRSRKALTGTANRALRAAAATRPAKHVSNECAATMTSLAGATKADIAP